MVEIRGYVGAPYNFVGISKRVNKKEKIQPHNIINTALKSGKIIYEIEAVTPIFISAGKENGKEVFYKNSYGKDAVPGSTVRGLVRNNVQVLSCSSVQDDIQNAALMYRNVASGKEQKYYNKILGNTSVELPGKNGKKQKMSVLKNVKAGYLRNEGGVYTIYPTTVDSLNTESGEMNYYVLSERKIMEDHYFGFEILKEMELQHKDGPFTKDRRKGKIHYTGKKNNAYRPYIREISYRLKGIRQVVEVASMEDGKENASGMRKGYLLSSGPMNEKKAIYVIPEKREDGKKIVIPKEDIESYKRDYEGKKKQIETIDKTFYRLPEDQEEKPVFYIQLDGNLYFGFTPRLRLFYEHDIHTGLSPEQKQGGMDYCKRLFGYTGENESYKSRLSFMDAEMIQESWETEEEVSMILGGPKPTSYLDYIEGLNGEAVSYNNDFKLRGVKQYWLKETPVRGTMGNNDKVATRFRPYKPEVAFKGEIRFQNLTEGELGMVLWGLLLEENSQQNIGKGKPYGYGRIKVRLTELQILNQKKLYDSAVLCLKPYQDETGKEKDYISCAKKEMGYFLGRDVMKEPEIRDFLLMKDGEKIPPSANTRYMELCEYQSRVNDGVQLQTVESVIKGDKIPKVKKQPYEHNDKQMGSSGNKGKGSGKKHKKQKSAFSSGETIGTSLGDL